MEKNKIIILVVGVAGSGKTTLGNELARRIVNGVFISKDFIQDVFTKTDRSGKVYELVQGPTFRLLKNFAQLQLQHGKIPIIDAPFSRNHNLTGIYRDWVAQFKKIADEHKSRLLIIRCIPPNHTELKSRLKKRGNLYDKWKLKNFDKFLKKEPILFPILHDDVMEIVTNRPSDMLAEDILKNITHKTAL